MGEVRSISAAANGQAPVGVALFAADAAEATGFAEMLHRLGQVGALASPGGLQAALRWCADRRADILVVDIDKEEAPLQAISELEALCDPTCRIVAVGGRADIDFYRALIHSGVVDYLQKPVRLDQFASALERARRNDYEDFARIGRSVAISGCAGGLGVSTVAAGLAQLLSTARRTPAAVVDFDRNKGDQSLLLGVSGDAGLGAALSSREIDLRLLQRAMISVNPRLKLLAQEPDFVDPEIDGDHLLELGSMLCQLFNQVIWDLPASRTKGVLEVLRHSETRILLVDLTVQAARSAQRLLVEIGDESDGQQLLLVQSPSHGGLGGIPRAQFEDYVGRRIDLALPYAGAALGESLLQGPLSLERSPAFKQALLDLADLVGGRKPQNVAKGGLMGKLKQVVNRCAPWKEARSC